MPAYIIADVDVTNTEQYAKYRELSPDAITSAGGRFVVRGGEVTVLEGNWNPSRVVVLEFATVEQARAFYDSPKYKIARETRAGATKHFNMILIEGI